MQGDAGITVIGSFVLDAYMLVSRHDLYSRIWRVEHMEHTSFHPLP